MQFRHAAEVWRTYPTLAAGALVADGPVRDPGPATAVRDGAQARARARLEGQNEGEWDEIRAWRRIYSRMGLKPTQYRCAAESLLRRLRRSGELPRVHPLIDLGNALSAAYAIPVAIFDLDRVAGDLIVRPADGDERYRTFAGEEEHPVPGEIIFADDERLAHARRWVTRQSGRSAVGASTRRILMVAEAHHDGAAEDVAALVGELTQAVDQSGSNVTVVQQLTAADPVLRVD